MSGIDKVVVVGGGTMGHGIAQVCALAGHPTVVVDVSEERVQRALARIRQTLDEGVDREKVASSARDEALSRLTGSTNLDLAVARAHLVIEAVPERMDLKEEIFRYIDRSAPDDAIFASNTSSLSISDLQEHSRFPRRVIGLHFFNPVHIMKLVEVVRGRKTADHVVERTAAFARQIEKEPIIVNDSPGFASSRLGVALGLEAMRMLEGGVASAADIDRAMELGYRHPMGPLRLTDLIGLDVRLDIARYLHAELGEEHFRPPAILERLVEEGKLGRKTGEGFYRWDT